MEKCIQEILGKEGKDIRTPFAKKVSLDYSTG